MKSCAIIITKPINCVKVYHSTMLSPVSFFHCDNESVPKPQRMIYTHYGISGTVHIVKWSAQCWCQQTGWREGVGMDLARLKMYSSYKANSVT